MRQSELIDAACLWLQHQRWKIVDAVEQDRDDDDGFRIVEIEASKNKDRKKFLVIQHRFWFDDTDFQYHGDSDANHFNVPRHNFIDEPRHILCFNNCRAYAIYIDETVEHSASLTEAGRLFVHREDLKILSVPWRLWALDAIPEWLQRGWPNPMEFRCGEVGKPDTWRFHPSWCEEVIKLAETYQRLPTCVDDVDQKDLHGWRLRKWYRAWLETHDDLILPWSE